MNDTRATMKCPECGLGRDVRVPPPAKFWTAWRAGAWGLVLLLFLVLVIGSAWKVRRATNPGSSIGYPAFLGVKAGGTYNTLNELTTVGELSRVAAGEAAPTFTIEELIDQAEDRTQNKDPASRLVVMAWPRAQGSAWTARSYGWPFGWYSDLQINAYSDLSNQTPEPELVTTPPSVEWARGEMTIRHAGSQASRRMTSYDVKALLLILALALTMAWGVVLAVGWVARRKSLEKTRRSRWCLIAAFLAFGVALAVGLGWPMERSRVYARADVSLRRETSLRLSDLEKMRSQPGAERAVARVLYQSVTTPTVLPGSGLPEPQSATPEMLVLIAFDDKSKASVSRTHIGWPLAIFGWQRMERVSEVPQLEQDRGWRFTWLKSGPSTAALVREEKGNPHVVRTITLPLGHAIPVLAVVVLPSLLLVSMRAGWVHLRTHRRRRRGRCVGCGYELGGLDRAVGEPDANAAS